MILAQDAEAVGDGKLILPLVLSAEVAPIT
jgi:hypothetical protein